MLTGWLSRYRGSRPQESADDGRLEGIDLFEALVAEIHIAAMQVAAVTSAVTALQPAMPPKLVRSFADFLPQVPAVAGAIRRCQQELGLPRELSPVVDLMWGEIEDARKHATRFLAHLDAQGAPQAIKRHGGELASAWRKASTIALDAVDALEPQTRWRLAGLYSENSVVLARTLKAAIDGKQPCLDPRGNIFLPALPQRRRARRFHLMQHCTIRCGGVECDAIAKDISATGIGLTNGPALTLRQPIEITLENRRRLAGTVVWVNDGKVGVQFHSPLSQGDPLLAS